MCIAFSGIFYRWAAVTPETGTVYRAVFGLPLLILVAWVERRRYGPLPRRNIGLALLAGLFFAGDLTAWHHAIEAVGAGLATVLGNLQVLFVGIAAWLLLGERPSRAVFTAVPIVLVGVVLISGLIDADAYGRDPGLGVLLGVLTAICYAAYLLIIRRVGRDLRRPAGPVALSTAATAGAAILYGTATSTFQPVPPVESIAWLALLGVSAQSAGYLLISISLPRLPAVLTSIILLAQPVSTVLLSMVLLAEAPSAAQLAGVALVIGGIALATVPLGRVAGSVRGLRGAGT
jgi:drug/metabolite transporter (DMT)-like permease